MIITGIDPDLSGGIATIDMGKKEVVHLMKMPIFYHPVKNEKIIDANKVFACLQSAKAMGSTGLILEAASIRPMQGSSGRIMTHFGMLLAIGHIVFTRPAVIIAQPAKWKREMGLSTDKAISLALATERYPSHKSILSKKKNAGIAEAMLLCDWAEQYELKCTRG